MKVTQKTEALLKSHYGRDNLSEGLFDTLDRAGKQIASHRDTAAFDEFHIRGREATLELARLAGLHTGHHVLDLGCGVGGPSRLLAAEFGCRVTGIDLMDEFIELATRLALKVGLAEKVSFEQCNMLALPFGPHSFDVVWSQHTFMNIEDKSRLLAQIHRVLKPGGMLALYEILSGAVTPIHYPVQWASDPAINFLLSEAEMTGRLREAGFEMVQWQDTTAACTEWFAAVVDKMARHAKTATKGSTPPLGLNLIIGPTAAEKARNTARNLREDRIRVFYGVFRKI